MIEVRFALTGQMDVVRRLEAVEARASDLSPAWPAVDAVFHEIVKRQFASEGAQGGEAWASLAPATQAERRRRGFGPGHPILQRSGDLLRSLTTLNSDAISVHAPLYYARGTGVEYFAFHQSRAPRKRLPRRAMIELRADDKSELFRPIRLHLTGRDPSRNARSDAAFATSAPQTPGGLG
jgi:phage gpG-like protein